MNNIFYSTKFSVEKFMIMENFLQRINQIAKKEGITISNLEKIIGASKGVLYRAIRENTDISSKWVRLLLENFQHISPEWLMTGEGNMYKEEYFPQYDYGTQNRISVFCVSSQISEENFSKETGLTMTGIKKKYPNLNPVWLLTGTGDMFIHNIDGNYNIGSGNQAIGGSTININDTQVIQLQKRIEELEKLVEQKDKMIDILTGRK